MNFHFLCSRRYRRRRGNKGSLCGTRQDDQPRAPNATKRTGDASNEFSDKPIAAKTTITSVLKM